MKYPKGTKYVIGIDEVGRGPLAGPVTLCAFLVPVSKLAKVNRKLSGITDSKKLTRKKREMFEKLIKEVASQEDIKYAIASVSAQVIDSKGISFGIRNAISRTLKKLSVDPLTSYVYLDGSLHAPISFAQETIIKGDVHNWLISSASVLAKTHRDMKMRRYSKTYPEYGFDTHMGYGTKMHRENIRKYGPCDIHRKTWIH